MRMRRLLLAAAWTGVSLGLLLPATVLAKGGSGSGRGSGGGGGAKGGTPPKDEKVKPFKVGDVVKDVSVDKVDGGSWSAADASGKVTILYFAGKDKIGDMRKLHDFLKGRESKLVVIGVLEGIEKDKAKEDLKGEKEKVETTIAVDPKKDVLAHFAASGATAVAIIGTDSKLVYEAGSYDAKAVEAQIDKLLPPPAKPADKPGDTPPKK